MKPRILVVSPDAELLQPLVRELNPCFEVWFETAPIRAEERLRSMPELVLADIDVLDPAASGWQDFAMGCELSGVRCVLFRSGNTQGQQPGIPSWCDHYLPDIGAVSLVREYIRTLLQLDEISRRYELTQGQLHARQMEYEEGLRSAAHIQQSLMPDAFPEMPGITFASCFSPCQNVGGDLFNVLRLDEDTLGVYMLDVSGHGVPAAMVTVAVYQALSPHTGQIVKQPQDSPPYYRLNSPQSVLTELDVEYPFERFDAFFTISYMHIDPRTGVINYANGAHPSPLILRTDGAIEALDAEGTLVGLGGLVPFEQRRNCLFPGDRLFIFTDGMFEHENHLGEQFGLERLHQVLVNQRHLSLNDQCAFLLNALDEFGGHASFEDDVTLLAMEFSPEN